MLRRIFVLALSSTLLLAGFTAVAAEASRATTISSSIARPLAHEKYVISGHTKTSFARTVRLKYKSGKSWKTLTSKRSKSNGTYAFDQTSTKSLAIRIYAPKVTRKSKKYSALTSRTISVAVTTQSATLTSALTVEPGEALTVAAAFSPARSGRPVTLERLTGTTWQELASSRQSASGGSSFDVAVFDQPGEVQLRAVASAHHGAASAASASKSISVRFSFHLIEPANSPSGSNGVGSSLNEDGSLAAFSHAVPDEPAQIYVRDFETGSTTLVSATSEGQSGDFSSTNPRISADGRYVVYETIATNLTPGVDDGRSKIVLYDRTNETSTFVSVPDLGGFQLRDSSDPDISADGRYVVFRGTVRESESESGFRVLVVDMVDGDVTAVADADANSASISDNGRYVSYQQINWSKPDADHHVRWWDVYRYDLANGSTDLVSVRPDGEAGSQSSFGPSISADGSRVSFASRSTDFTDDPGPHPALMFVYVRDLNAGTTRRVSEEDMGDTSSNMMMRPDVQTISPDGNEVAYISWTSLEIPPVLKLVNLNTSARRTIVEHVRQSWGLALSLPQISADGLHITYRADDSLYRQQLH